MNLILQILDGPQRGQEYLISKSVSRIGSHPNSDIFVESHQVDAHVATLEYSNGQCKVHNRSENQLQFSHAILAPGQSADWVLGETLQLQDGTLLGLVEHSGNVSQGNQYNEETWDEDDSEDVEINEAESSTSNTSNLVQLFVIGVCLVAIIGIVYSQFIATEPAFEKTSVPKLSTLLNELENQKEQPNFDSLRQSIVAAELMYSRGQNEAARNAYKEIHQQLSRLKSENADQFSELESDLLIYAESKLAK